MSDPATILRQLSPLFKGVTFVGIVTGITKGFEWFEPVLGEDAQLRLSRWLTNVPGDEQIDAWAGVFPNLIDRVFGPKALSWKFFFRSCVASVIAVTALFILGFLVLGERGLLKDIADLGASLVRLIGLTFFLALLDNCIPDYLSVIISRFIVRLMAKRPDVERVALYLLLDTALTLLLALAWNIAVYVGYMCASAPTTTANLFRSGHGLSFVLSQSWVTLTGIAYYPIMWVYVGASLFTSVWVWLYILASVSIRILHKVRFVWVKVVPFLNLDKKPMQSIGRLAGLMAGVGYLALSLGVWLIRHL
jgi:hypothetical protein